MYFFAKNSTDDNVTQLNPGQEWSSGPFNIQNNIDFYIYVRGTNITKRMYYYIDISGQQEKPDNESYWETIESGILDKDSPTTIEAQTSLPWSRLRVKNADTSESLDDFYAAIGGKGVR